LATKPKPVAVIVADEFDAPPPPPRRSLMRFVPLAVLIGLIVLVFALGLDRYANLESLRTHRVLLIDFVERSVVLAAFAYLALYVVLTSLSLPWASLLTIAGGFLFGPWLATGLTVVGATIGAIAIYWIAGSALGEPLRAKLRRLLPGGRMERIEAGFRANAFAYTLALRLAPIFPFVAVNLAAALLAVPLRAYTVATALGIVPGTAVYALFGAGLGDVIARSDAPALSAALPPSLIGAFFGMALLAIIPVAIRRFRRRA
jgi:uncharacterized membrane protein YdjX (TVP38/TMEM64 family)